MLTCGLATDEALTSRFCGEPHPDQGSSAAREATCTVAGLDGWRQTATASPAASMATCGWLTFSPGAEMICGAVHEREVEKWPPEPGRATLSMTFETSRKTITVVPRPSIASCGWTGVTLVGVAQSAALQADTKDGAAGRTRDSPRPERTQAATALPAASTARAGLSQPVQSVSAGPQAAPAGRTAASTVVAEVFHTATASPEASIATRSTTPAATGEEVSARGLDQEPAALSRVAALTVPEPSR